MPKILAAEVMPFYAQVLLTTSPDAQHPQFETGDEAVVASAQAAAISTVPDRGTDGPQVVAIEVWLGDCPEMADWSELGRVPMLVSSWGVAVQDVVSSKRHHAEVPPGEYEVGIYGRPAIGPSQVRVVFMGE